MSAVRRGQVTTFFLLWLAYCSTYLLRKPLGVVKLQLGAELGLSKAGLGWCDTALVLPYAAIQILVPGLASRHPPRLLLSGCLGLAALATALTYTGPLSHSLPGLCLGLALTGGLLAPCWPAATASLSSWFPDSRLNSVFGLINTATYSGSLGGTALAAALLEYSGWRSVGPPPALLALAAAGLVWLLLLSPAERGVTVPGKTQHQKEPLLAAEPELEAAPSLLAISRLPCVRQLAAAMFSLKFVRYCMAMWLPLYLLEHLGYTQLQAGIFSTVFDLGGILGSPLLGLLLDTRLPEAPLLGVCLTMVAGTVATTVFVLTASWGLAANCLCLLVAGAANCGPDSILAGSVTNTIGERAGRGRGGAVTSLVNGVGNVGGIVEGPLIGLLSVLLGWEGVLVTLVGVSALGTLATYQAFIIDKRNSAVLPT